MSSSSSLKYTPRATAIPSDFSADDLGMSSSLKYTPRATAIPSDFSAASATPSPTQPSSSTTKVIPQSSSLSSTLTYRSKDKPDINTLFKQFPDTNYTDIRNVVLPLELEFITPFVNSSYKLNVLIAIFDTSPQPPGSITSQDIRTLTLWVNNTTGDAITMHTVCIATLIISVVSRCFFEQDRDYNPIILGELGDINNAMCLFLQRISFYPFWLVRTLSFISSSSSELQHDHDEGVTILFPRTDTVIKFLNGCAVKNRLIHQASTKFKTLVDLIVNDCSTNKRVDSFVLEVCLRTVQECLNLICVITPLDFELHHGTFVCAQMVKLVDIMSEGDENLKSCDDTSFNLFKQIRDGLFPKNDMSLDNLRKTLAGKFEALQILHDKWLVSETAKVDEQRRLLHDKNLQAEKDLANVVKEKKKAIRSLINMRQSEKFKLEDEDEDIAGNLAKLLAGARLDGMTAAENQRKLEQKKEQEVEAAFAMKKQTATEEAESEIAEFRKRLGVDDLSAQITDVQDDDDNKPPGNELMDIESYGNGSMPSISGKLLRPFTYSIPSIMTGENRAIVFNQPLHVDTDKVSAFVVFVEWFHGYLTFRDKMFGELQTQKARNNRVRAKHLTALLGRIQITPEQYRYSVYLITKLLERLGAVSHSPELWSSVLTEFNFYPNHVQCVLQSACLVYANMEERDLIMNHEGSGKPSANSMWDGFTCYEGLLYAIKNGDNGRFQKEDTYIFSEVDLLLKELCERREEAAKEQSQQPKRVRKQGN